MLKLNNKILLFWGDGSGGRAGAVGWQNILSEMVTKDLLEGSKKNSRCLAIFYLW